MRDRAAMGWLRLVGSFKSYVSCAREPYKRDYILQKRPVVFRSLLIVAIPHHCKESLEFTVIATMIPLYNVPIESLPKPQTNWKESHTYGGTRHATNHVVYELGGNTRLIRTRLCSPSSWSLSSLCCPSVFFSRVNAGFFP